MTYDDLRVQLGLSEGFVLAEVDNRLKEMGQEMTEGEDVRFVDMSEAPGYCTYTRSANLLFYTAIYKMLGEQGVNQVIFRHSVGNAFYYEYTGSKPALDSSFINEIESAMKAMVSSDLPITKERMRTDDAIEYFRQTGRMDKVKLLKYRRVSNTNVYRIGEYKDYYYGYMVPSTGRIKKFRLSIEDEYICLTLPSMSQPDVLPELVHQPKLLHTLETSKKWSDTLEVGHVGDLNDKIVNGDIHELILVQEALQENLLSRIADQIVDQNKRIILIAGPSSSGKTTFSNRLSIQLKVHGLHPHPIAMDDFFKDRIYAPKLPNGEYDFESIECMDIDLFNDCMIGLLNGDDVVMPYYDFISGTSKRHQGTMKIGEKDVLIIEGIHGLNERMSQHLPKDAIYKIYVSALTQLSIDLHNRIPTTDCRLLRRIVRDARIRGYDARETIHRWPTVRAGEETNIFPYQEEADVFFNSAQVYELCVLKQQAEPLLFAVPRDCPEYKEAKRLLKFLDYFLGINDHDIPINSIVREFIGGGCFKV